MLTTAILAGGLATRLRPLTETIPKALIDINGEPFVYHQLRLLRAQGIQHVVMCCGFLGEMIVAAVGDGSQFGLEVRYAFDGKILLGTAGALKRALPLLGESFFVLYGDSYLPCDFMSVQQGFLARQCQAVMTVFHNQGQWDGSNVEYRDSQLIAYDKRQPTERMHYIDYGLGVFHRTAFDQVVENQPHDLADLYVSLLTQGQLAGVEVYQRFYEIGSHAGIAELGHYLSMSTF